MCQPLSLGDQGEDNHWDELRPYVAFHAALRAAFHSLIASLEQRCRSLVREIRLFDACVTLLCLHDLAPTRISYESLLPFWMKLVILQLSSNYTNSGAAGRRTEVDTWLSKQSVTSFPVTCALHDMH